MEETFTSSFKITKGLKRNVLISFRKASQAHSIERIHFTIFFSTCLMNVRQEGLRKHLSKSVFYTEEDKSQLQRDPTETKSYIVTQKTRNILFGLLY